MAPEVVRSKNEHKNKPIPITECGGIKVSIPCSLLQCEFFEQRHVDISEDRKLISVKVCHKDGTEGRVRRARAVQIL
jgi:hypothetical protein